MDDSRRAFMGRLVGGSALAATGIMVPGIASGSPAGRPEVPAPRADARWDFAWIRRIRGRHRAW